MLDKRADPRLVRFDRSRFEIPRGLLARPARQHRLEQRLLQMQRAHVRAKTRANATSTSCGEYTPCGLNKLRITRK
jgi:hypothetical protein